MVRRVLLPWYNSFKFLQTYAAIDNWQAKDIKDVAFRQYRRPVDYFKTADT